MSQELDRIIPTNLNWFSGRLGRAGRMRSVLMMAVDNNLLRGIKRVDNLLKGLNRETLVQGWFDFDHYLPTQKHQLES